VVDHLKVGGAQTHLVQLLEGLDRRRFAPQVCALKRTGELLDAMARLGVPVRDGGLGRTVMGPSGAAVLWRLCRLMRRERIDVAHAYLFHPNVLAPLAARLARVPAVIVSKRSLDRYPSRPVRWAVRAGNALADRVMVNAEAIARFVAAEESCPRSRMTLVPNGVGDETLAAPADRAAARAALGLPADAPVVGALSRLTWKKGVTHLVAAAPRLLEAVPDARVVVAGDGELRGELEAQARALGVGDRVRFLGTRRDPLALLAAIDVLALPSVVEGMSNALLEAMARGRPVVATDVGGNPEVVVDGETGFVVPAGDPERLAAAVGKLLQAPELAAEMGAAGRRRVEARYRAAHMVAAVERLYDEVLTRAAA
jgi:glycosyltransferase involved in cell wall biosynthesis